MDCIQEDLQKAVLKFVVHYVGGLLFVFINYRRMIAYKTAVGFRYDDEKTQCSIVYNNVADKLFEVQNGKLHETELMRVEERKRKHTLEQFNLLAERYLSVIDFKGIL